MDGKAPDPSLDGSQPTSDAVAPPSPPGPSPDPSLLPQQKPRRASFIPRCSHATMTKIYDTNYRCSYCRRQPECGWLYRCTVDRDLLIYDREMKGRTDAFDPLGCHFAQYMSLGKFGPDVRSQPDSVLKEMTKEQMDHYTPEELVKIVAQRENVRRVIAEERSRPDEAFSRNKTRLRFPDDDRPWVPSEQFECQHKACHRCYPVGAERSWVSLNAVANGDIAPSLAIGFSWSYSRTRPPCPVFQIPDFLPAVPLPMDHPARAPQEPPPVGRSTTPEGDPPCGGGDGSGKQQQDGDGPAGPLGDEALD